MSFKAAIIALLVTACTATPTGVLTGRAIFDGETDHSGIIVSVSGEASAVTNAAGTFTVTGLRSGRATVVFAAIDALEPTQSRVADVGSEITDVVFHGTARVTGTVIDAATQDPLAGALILSTGGSAAATSAADGTFTLAGIRTGEATVVVSSSGLTPQQKSVHLRRHVPFELGTIALGPLTPDTGPTGIAGQIVFADGTPADSTTVRIQGTQVDRQTVTGADGRFRFEQVRTGVFSLEATRSGFAVNLPTVLAIEGTSGMIISGGLYPLASTPIQLTRGRYLSGLTGGTVTPDGQTVIGPTFTNAGRNLTAVPLDGGPQVDLLSQDEVGLSIPQVVAIGVDSTTLAVSLYDPNNGQLARQTFLASTVSEGRQLISERACSVGNQSDSFYFIIGNSCQQGGQLAVTNLKFGAPPAMLGTLSSSWRADLAHQQIFDFVPRPSPSTKVDIDVVSVGPQPSRRRVASNVGRTVQLSPDGKFLTVLESTSAPYGAFDLVNVATGQSLNLVNNQLVWQQSYASAGKVIASGYDGPIAAFDLVTGAATPLANQQSGWWVSGDGARVFLFHKRSDSVLGSIGRVSTTGGIETPIGDSVGWYGGSPDGQWLYFVDTVDLATQRGRLMRVASGTAAPVLLDSNVSVESSQSPLFSEKGEALAYVRRTGDAFDGVVLDAATGKGTVLAPLEAPSTYRWKFSPSARYLSYDSVLAAHNTLHVQRVSGGPRIPVGNEIELVWLGDRAALVYRYLAKPAVGPVGVSHATFD